MTDLERIENKLDIILSALGLDGKARMSPVQIKEEAQRSVLNFLEKRRKKHEHDHPKSARGCI